MYLILPVEPTCFLILNQSIFHIAHIAYNYYRYTDVKKKKKVIKGPESNHSNGGLAYKYQYKYR